jgi:hypothetical protein
MWFKSRPRTLARMPSTRAQPLNPRASQAPGGPAAPPDALASTGQALVEASLERERATQAGAFHESSYELRAGLEVNESEWPEEVTIPAALGKD